MSNNQLSPKSLRGRRSAYGWPLLGALFIAAGCSAPVDNVAAGDQTGGGEQVAKAHEALTQCLSPATDCKTATISTTSLSLKDFVTIGKDFVNLLVDVYTKNKGKGAMDGFSIVNDIYGVFSEGPDLGQSVNCIEGTLGCFIAAQSYQQNTNTYGDYAGTVKSAYLNLANFTDPNYAGTAYANSSAATQSAGDISMFAHAYVPQLTDGDGQWKGIFQGHNNQIDPDVIAFDSNNLYEIFDWRLGFSRFTALIPLELAIMGTYDPNFITNGKFNKQLDGATSDWQTDPVPGYRQLLQSHLQQMLKGVRCDYAYTANRGTSTAVCADINTGLSKSVNYPSSAAPNYDDLRRRLLLQMPVFEVNSMIDSLYHVTHPLPDLTEGSGRIPLDENANLCLDVLNGNSGTPAVLSNCNGTYGQNWTYNRTAGTISNTSYGKCLQVRPNDASTANFDADVAGGGGDNLSQGAFAEISDCISPPPLRQQWTYDPEKLIIRSALGTVLDVKGYQALQLPAQIQLADENDGGSQRWRAELGTQFCQDTCNHSMCPSSCGGAGANAGACWSACMPACVQECSGPGPVNKIPAMPQRISGDFNGDGVADMIIVTASGSYEYLGQWGGGFTPDVWVRNDLTLGNVSYITGDFNGDWITDLIIVTAGGSYEYLGQWYGGFTPDVWVRNDLTLGVVDYTAGDFNGDGMSDLMIVTAGGSYEYTGLAGGGFTGDVWVRPDLSLGNVGYVPGNFNGDSATDLIVATSAGTYEYMGLAGGGLARPTITTYVPYGNGTMIPVTATLGFVSGSLGSARYIPGDFDGDGLTDLIIVTAQGSNEYKGAPQAINQIEWSRPDLTLDTADYIPGDFNGDGIADLMIVTADGTYEYTGIYGGGFNPDVWVRNDLTRRNVSYFKGDFTGDGYTDLGIVAASGSYEYTGNWGGGFTWNVWVRSDWTLGAVDYF